MVIDNRESFDTYKDKLVWTKIININLFANTKSMHLVKYYKTESKEEYYIFEYIRADNNGVNVDNFNEQEWGEIKKQIDFSDGCYIYSHNIYERNNFKLITRGKVINRYKVETNNMSNR